MNVVIIKNNITNYYYSTEFKNSWKIKHIEKMKLLQKVEMKSTF